MGSINICTETDQNLFYKVLARLNKAKGFILQGNVLQDMDSSLLAIFTYKGKEVKLINDEDVGALFINYEGDLKKEIEDALSAK